MSKQSKQVARLNAQRQRAAMAERLNRMSDNEIAATIRASATRFLDSHEWRRLRAEVIAHYGPQCMCCGATPQPWNLNVDHIKPRKHFPELALAFDNLQVLCAHCNKAKGNKHSTDYRPKKIYN